MAIYRKQFLEMFFDELSARGINYCVIRNHARIFDRSDKDIDLMVNPSDFERVKYIFRNISQKSYAVFISDEISQKSLYLKSLVIDSGENVRVEGVYIHCVGFVTLKDSQLARRLSGVGTRIWLSSFKTELAAVDNCLVKVPPPKFQLLLLLAKYEQNRNPRYVEEIRQFIARCNLDDWVEEITPHRGQPADIKALYADIEPAHLRLLVKKLSAEISPVYPTFKLFEYAALAKANIRGLFKLKGKLIFFSGPDGSGKTSANTALTQALAEKLQVTVENRKALYPLSLRMQRRLARLQAKIRNIQPSDMELIERDRGNTFNWRARRLVGLIILLLQVPVGYFHARLLNLIGRTVVVDTSFFDAFIKGHRPPFPLLQKFFIPLLPSGDYWFLMCAPSKVIVERKPELTEAEIERYYDYFHSLRRQPINIDSARGIDRALLDIFSAIKESQRGQ